MDDFILMHEDKEYLKMIKNKLEEELLNTYKLKLNRKKQYYQVVKMALTFVVIDLE